MTIGASPAQAVIFDVFGTCVDWRTGVAAAVENDLLSAAADVDPLAFADAWRAEYQPAMQRIRAGDRGYIDLDILHRENLDRILARFDLEHAFGETSRAAMTSAWEKLPPWPDVLPGLRTMKASAIIAPCSNGSIALMTRLARYSGLPWDCILGAAIARDYKPKPIVYQAACAALRLAPASVVMVAAHNDDLAAARAAGLGTAFVPRPTEHGPHQSTDLAAEQDWDYVAADFNDLAEMLARA
jgi:2-haloacid dehalogenase